jgi:NAD(P)-dependent dehydrogenase (short-subunit alcohol dehydrogenase family)
VHADRRELLLSLASTSPMTGYSASKAAAHSLTQALRPGLAARRITVHGVYPGGIDTDMLAGIEAPRTPRPTWRVESSETGGRRGGHLPRPQLAGDVAGLAV